MEIKTKFQPGDTAYTAHSTYIRRLRVLSIEASTGSGIPHIMYWLNWKGIELSLPERQLAASKQELLELLDKSLEE